MPTEGLILGRMESKPPSIWEGVKALFNPRVPSDVANRRFLRAIRRKKQRHLVRLSHAVHTAVFAPTGAGKGVSFVVPHLLTCRDSMVVVDFKGDLARETADHRRKTFGHRCVLLDPFGVVTREGDSLNAIDGIDPTEVTSIDDCRDLAEALVLRTGQEKDPHWADSAEAMIASMIALVVTLGEPGNRSLQTIRSLLTNTGQMQNAINAMIASEAWDGMMSRLGHQLTHFKDKELGSVLTTTNRFLRFLDTPAVAQCTVTSSFDPAEINNGRMTVYLILPPDHMRAQSALLRMWISALMRAVVRGGLVEHGGQRKVQFVLDEAASLGHMDVLGDALDKFRAYGVRLTLMYQSLGQLKKCWPEGQDQTLLSNVTQVFFGVNDYETAEYISNRLGEETIQVDSGGSNTGGSTQSSSSDPNKSHGSSWGSNDGWSQAARRLLKPEEVLALDKDVAITFAPGLPPIITVRLEYHRERLGVPPGRWSGFWIWTKTVIGAVLCFFAAAILTLVLMAGLSAKRTQRTADVPPTYQR